jgi:DnaK suppressor protein
MDKEKLREKIEREINLLGKKIKDLKELTQPIAPEIAIGRVSRMDAINNKSVNDMALRQAEFKMKKLNMALSKLSESKFGKCARCGNDIQEGRLMLLPENEFCIYCADRA